MPIHPACLPTAQQHASLVERTALQIHKTLPDHVHLLDELMHVGQVAFLEAVQRFTWQDNENPTFYRFAYLRIRGAMYDELRRRDTVPHRVRARQRRVNSLEARHQAETGGRLSPDELVSHGVSLRVQSALADVREVISLDANQEAGARVPDERPNPEQACNLREMRHFVQQAFNTLTDVERFVVSRYFEHGFTLVQIAAHLGCTESRVCQIKGASLRKLRAALEGAGCPATDSLL